MLGLKPIKLLPARERVASALRKAIIAQQIKEGETLTLETTAQQLGVSITPVREAFQILERDGLISLQQSGLHKGELRGMPLQEDQLSGRPEYLFQCKTRHRRGQRKRRRR